MSRRRIFSETQAGGPGTPTHHGSTAPVPSMQRTVKLNEAPHPTQTSQSKPKMIDGLLKIDSLSSNLSASPSTTVLLKSFPTDEQLAVSKDAKAYTLPQLREERRRHGVNEIDPMNDELFTGQMPQGMQETIDTSKGSSATQRPLSRQESSMKNMELKLVPLTGDTDISSPAPWNNGPRPSSSQRPLSRMGSSGKVHIDLGAMSGGKGLDYGEGVSSVNVPRVEGIDFSVQRINSFSSRTRSLSPSRQESYNRFNHDSPSWPPKLGSDGAAAGSSEDTNTPQGLGSNQLTSKEGSVNVVKISSDHPMRLGNTSGSYRASNRAIAGVEQYSTKIKAISGKYIQQQKDDQNSDVDLEDPNGPDCITHICLMFR